MFIIEENLPGLNLVALVEPNVNHAASTFAAENLTRLISQARKMNGVDPFKAEDLVQDLIESLLKSEAAGEGYDINRSREGSVITVEDFVFGRMKRYSQNNKYKIDGCDRHTSTKRVDGEIKTVVDFEVSYASSSDESDVESMTGIQRAYATAKSYDDNIESVDESISLRQNIEFCTEFNEIVGFNFLNLFRNIEKFASAEYDEGMFDRLRRAFMEHDQLKAAFEDVVMASSNNHGAFEEVMAQFA